MTFQDEVIQQRRECSERDERVLAGIEVAPPCYTCRAQSTHISEQDTPAGSRAYQCARHVPSKPQKLWGADPGWQITYMPLPEARS